ncbi:MAG: peptidoglycan-binding domain-containing protein, partial [Candidatus Nomurabacteria bacterium]
TCPPAPNLAQCPTGQTGTLTYDANKCVIGQTCTPTVSVCTNGATNPPDCTILRPNVIQSLYSTSHANMNISAGSSNVETITVSVLNEGTSDVNLNGIHLASSSNLNNFITNTKALDYLTNTQVGQTINNFDYNGSYYYAWVNFSPSIAIPAGTKKVFKVYSDIIGGATGSFTVGSWGLNFDTPGASMSPQQINGNTITVNNTIACPSIIVPSVLCAPGTMRNPTYDANKCITSYTDCTPISMCDYAAPQNGCTYVKGPDYNSTNGCGMVMDCSTATKCLNGATNPPTCTLTSDGCLPGQNFSSTTGASCPVITPTNVITRTLKIGMKGDDVKILQTYLGLTADGYFGRSTRIKVIQWQKVNGLTADGVFGPSSILKSGLGVVIPTPSPTPIPTPLCTNGASNPPTCTAAPTCLNGAVNLPSCTISISGACLNGASNPPVCTTPTPSPTPIPTPLCTNGASNPPTCTLDGCASGQNFSSTTGMACTQ